MPFNVNRTTIATTNEKSPDPKNAKNILIKSTIKAFLSLGVTI